MKPNYDPELYSALRFEYSQALLFITSLEEDQRDTRKLLNTMKANNKNFPVVRHMVVRNRARLRVMNEKINAYYRFCEEFNIKA